MNSALGKKGLMHPHDALHLDTTSNYGSIES